jgi:cysteine desulfurase
LKFPIYLDSHATTPVDPRVLDAMLPYFTEKFGNAASIDHEFGSVAAKAVNDSRKIVAKCINASEDEIIFTSGATESDNIALQGLFQKYPGKNHIITCLTEHKAVLDTCKHLEKHGKYVTYIGVDEQGTIDLEALEDSISKTTLLISVMTANNEVGTIAPIEQIGKIAQKYNVLFHTDAAQAAGHISLDVKKMCVDLMSISGHKMYGPKGVGALYVNKKRLNGLPEPLIFGGGHEQGVRSGTLNVPGIVGLSKAFEIGNEEQAIENERFGRWTKRMLEIFVKKASPVFLNGHPEKRLQHNLNVSFDRVENKALLQMVNGKIALSTGSACTTTNVEPSHVILAMGLGEERAHSAIRFGFDRFNTEKEIEFVTDLLIRTISRLRKINFS